MAIERLLLLPAMGLLLGAAGMLAPVASAVPSLTGPDRVVAHYAAAASGQPERIESSPDGLFRIPARAGNARFELVLDTGATSTMLTRATLDAIASQGGTVTFLDEPPALYQTVGGRTALHRAEVRDLRIAGQTVRSLKVAVLEAGTASNILGTDLLGMLGPIQARGHMLELGARPTA